MGKALPPSRLTKRQTEHRLHFEREPRTYVRFELRQFEQVHDSRRASRVVIKTYGIMCGKGCAHLDGWRHTCAHYGKLEWLANDLPKFGDAPKLGTRSFRARGCLQLYPPEWLPIPHHKRPRSKTPGHWRHKEEKRKAFADDM